MCFSPILHRRIQIRITVVTLYSTFTSSLMVEVYVVMLSPCYYMRIFRFHEEVFAQWQQTVFSIIL